MSVCYKILSIDQVLLVKTLDSRYLAVIYNTILDTEK